MASPKKLRLKLLVDKEKKRVVFAEYDKDFVDLLFSFLTMPVGTIIRLLNKQACLGCMDKLYESVENLKDMYFNTEACKVMLLNPLNACRSHYTDLVLRIDDSEPQSIYTCRNNECRTKSFPFFSSVPKARCRCGEIMDSGWYWREEEWKGPNGDGVFVKGTANFLITDDLHIMPASTNATQYAFEKLAIKDLGSLEETAIDLDVDKLRDLFKRSLLSKYPLSGMYFQEPNIIDNVEFQSNFTTLPKIEKDLTKESKMLKAKFLICKSSKKVVYAEAGGDGFVDLLLSFLTFPLGSVVKLLDKFSSIGCVDNLYDSVEKLIADNSCIKFEKCKSTLVHPKVAPYFGCSNSPLPYIEQPAMTRTIPGCNICFTNKINIAATQWCAHGLYHVSIGEMNPKLQASIEVGGGYAKKEVKFMITDELEVTPFSSLGSLQTVKKQDAAFFSLEEKEIDVGEFEEFDLRAALPLGFFNSALNFGVAAGAIMPWGSGFLNLPSPLHDRFYIGGNTSPVCTLSGPSSLLGFKTRGLGPTDSRRLIPNTSNDTASQASAERDYLGGDLAITSFADLSFDLPLELFRKAGIHGHVFASAGNLAKLTEGGLKNFSPRNFLNTARSSAGFGVIIPTKLFRMEINYCYVLKQSEYDKGKTGIQFNFSAPM